MDFSIITLGCKVNAYESESMKELLIDSNFNYIEDYKKAGIVIVNTCSVTNNADGKSRKLIRRVKKENKDCILVVCGCSVQNHFEDYQKFDIDILIGNKQKSKIVELINNFIDTNQKYSFFNSNRNVDFEHFNVSRFTSHTRAFLKIQDGCDNFCSYCIIPFVRGHQRSKVFAECLKEAKMLVANGHKELVLTGIHTGSYNYDGYDLTDLVHEISKIKGLSIIRISSIEITELNDKFLSELMNNSKIADHLHIPLQAGTDKILKLMNRKYDLKFYLDKIKHIRKIRPKISISTDLIVGFPNETEDDFASSYDFCRKCKFSKIHVFPYSIRTGTKASLMDNQVSESCKKNRSEKMVLLSKQLEEAYAKSFINEELELLVEEIKDGISIGHTSNYLKIKVNKILEKNHIYKVKITKVIEDDIWGDAI